MWGATEEEAGGVDRGGSLDIGESSKGHKLEEARAAFHASKLVLAAVGGRMGGGWEPGGEPRIWGLTHLTQKGLSSGAVGEKRS